MHSGPVDTNGSPRKRTLSRGISEDESLRSIIKEAESSSRRLTRSDSRAGTLKRRSDSQQSDLDLSMGHPDMLELQSSYDAVVQELHGLEIERETLLFQVNVLQDTLESVEELLAETQGEAKQASSELEQEREAKRKLESMVSSLMEEVERLKEERNDKPSEPVSTQGSGCDQVDAITTQEHQVKYAPGSEESQSSESRDGVSEEVTQSGDVAEEGNILQNLRRVITKPLNHMPSLALENPFSEEGVLRRSYDTDCSNGRDPSPDRNDSDSISAYEDAYAETPEQDGLFPGEAGTLELPADSENLEERSANSRVVSEDETGDPKNPENCVVS
ncbi:golgin subfamily A member 2 [Antennarius striatus]|uniref:golgin subfamily A member 2 n=1 Tax=Antennarius striatus TaxID=241820 RepID=UPI0035AEDCD3